VLSEHIHCDNVATNGNGEKVRSRMETNSVGKLEYRENEDESSTGQVGLLDFTMLRPVLVWRAFETYKPLISSLF
jgi:hypothetical protein